MNFFSIVVEKSDGYRYHIQCIDNNFDNNLRHSFRDRSLLMPMRGLEENKGVALKFFWSDEEGGGVGLREKNLLFEGDALKIRI